METILYSHDDPVSLMATKLYLKVKPETKFNSKKNIVKFLSEIPIKMDTQTIIIGLSVNYSQLSNDTNEQVCWITPYDNGNLPNENNSIISGSSKYYNDTLSIVEEIADVTLRLRSGASISDILMKINTLEATPGVDTLFLLNALDHNKIPALIDDNYVVQRWGSLPVNIKDILHSTQTLNLKGVNVLVADNSISYDEAKSLVGDSDGIVYLDFKLKGNSLVKFVFKREEDLWLVVNYLREHDFDKFKVTGTSGYGVLPLSWLNIILAH